MKMSWGLKFIDRLMAMSILNYNTEIHDTMGDNEEARARASVRVRSGHTESVNKFTVHIVMLLKRIITNHLCILFSIIIFHYHVGVRACAFSLIRRLYESKNQEQHSHLTISNLYIGVPMHCFVFTIKPTQTTTTATTTTTTTTKKPVLDDDDDADDIVYIVKLRCIEWKGIVSITCKLY